jgi:predicted dehydrogenase
MPVRPELTAAPRPASSSRLRFVIAGAGSAGLRHLRNLRTLGFSDVTFYRATSRPLRVAHPVRVERDLECALEGAPGALIVANPTALHLDVALPAARAGWHLLVEKPVSDTTAGLPPLREEVERRRLVAMVGYHLRFHPGLQRVRSWLAEGAVGEVVSARAHWGEYLPAWHPGEDYRSSYSARRDLGGGVVLTLSHPIDYLRWLLGEVTSVSAETACRSGLELEVEDTALVTLRFASGALGCVSLDYAERPASHELHVVGRNGSIRWSAADGTARLLEPDGGTVRSCAPPAGFERNSMFLAELTQFVGCVRDGGTPACTLDDGVRALELALAARRSAREGRRIHV